MWSIDRRTDGMIGGISDKMIETMVVNEWINASLRYETYDGDLHFAFSEIPLKWKSIVSVI